MQVAARVGNALHFYYREEENSSHQIRLLQHGEHLLTVLQASWANSKNLVHRELFAAELFSNNIYKLDA